MYVCMYVCIYICVCVCVVLKSISHTEVARAGVSTLLQLRYKCYEFRTCARHINSY
jgi:hypothetical protein